MRRPVRLLGALPLVAAFLLTAWPLSAQIISPGKLSESHAELEGIRNCTRCHELGKAGVSRTRCLECHELVSRRIEEGTGFHSTLAEDDCATCHKDHLGPRFDVMRFDTASFEHERAGFTLEGAHRDVGCRDCHRPELVEDGDVRSHFSAPDALADTWLGVSRTCAVCHESDDPHAGQFRGRACTDCHGPETWEGAEGFDHAATAYRLRGRHRTVDCSGCHAREGGGAGGTVRYAPVAHGSCATCHQADDPHDGAMTGSCATCHVPEGWTRVRAEGVEGRFDHGRTSFALEGRHDGLDCAACHDPAVAAGLEAMEMTWEEGTRNRAFPRPITGSCGSCHVDAHAGAFEGTPGGTGCQGCHDVEGWLPSDYDLARHNREAAFPLEGAHLTVPCASCHRNAEAELVVRPAAATCAACHRETDPHGGQFDDRDCSACHSVASFDVSDFDHSGTRFPLDGAHGGLECAACHEPLEDGTVQYAPLGTACRDCHAGAAG